MDVSVDQKLEYSTYLSLCMHIFLPAKYSNSVFNFI